MKNPKPGILCLLFVLFCVFANAQTLPIREPDLSKPLLFQQFPERLNISSVNLESLLQYETGRQVSITFTPDLTFQGVVSSVASKDKSSITSTVIRSVNFQGAALSLSKVARADGSSYFTGRIMSFQHGDGFEISFEDGQYYLIKKGLYDMMNE